MAKKKVEKEIELEDPFEGKIELENVPENPDKLSDEQMKALSELDDDFEGDDSIAGYESHFKKDSVEKSLESEDFPDFLNVRLNAIYKATILEAPKLVNTKFGETWVMTIDNQGMPMTLACTEAILYKLTVYRQRLGMTPGKFKKWQVGQKCAFQKLEKLIDGKIRPTINFRILK